MVHLRNASGKGIYFPCVPGMPGVFFGHGYWIGICPWESQRSRRFVLAWCKDSLKPSTSLSISLSVASLLISAMWFAKLSWSLLFKSVCMFLWVWHWITFKAAVSVFFCIPCIKYHYYLTDLTEMDVHGNDTCLWLCKQQKFVSFAGIEITHCPLK